MSFFSTFSSLFRKKTDAPTLSEPIQQRLEQWQNLAETDLGKTFVETDCVILDLETSGFSFKNDHLIAIGACRIENGVIPLGKSFQIILKQDESSSKENILIHHIGDSDQRTGIEPAEALMQFLEYMGKAPLIAYHVDFDQPMLNKALEQYLGIDLKRHTWFDVAFLGPLFLPNVSTTRQNLDFWANHFNITNPQRHSAVFDAISTAEIMLAVMKQPIKSTDDACIGDNLTMQTLIRMEQRARKVHRQLHGH